MRSHLHSHRCACTPCMRIRIQYEYGYAQQAPAQGQCVPVSSIHMQLRMHRYAVGYAFASIRSCVCIHIQLHLHVHVHLQVHTAQAKRSACGSIWRFACTLRTACACMCVCPLCTYCMHNNICSRACTVVARLSLYTLSACASVRRRDTRIHTRVGNACRRMHAWVCVRACVPARAPARCLRLSPYCLQHGERPCEASCICIHVRAHPA